MANQCIVIADRARARFFVVKEAEDPSVEGGPNLAEQEDMVNPEGQLTDAELFADRRSGHAYSAPAGGYAVNDGKDRERLESAHRFVTDLSAATAEFVRSRKADELVVVATPKFLGLLRPEIRKVLPKSTKLVELDEELTWHALPHIQDVLTRRGVLPPRELPDSVYTPRTQPPPSARRTRPRKP
jgi:protein required for attachment to host cells